MNKRKRTKRPRIERISIAVTNHMGSILDDDVFDRLQYDFLIYCIMARYCKENISPDEVVELVKKDDFFPVGMMHTGMTSVSFIRVSIRETLDLFGVGKFVSVDSPEAQHVARAMTEMPDIEGTDFPNEEHVKVILDKGVSEEATRVRAEANNRIDDYMENKDEMPVPVIMCQSDFTSNITPTDMVKAFIGHGDEGWNELSVLTLDELQWAFHRYMTHIVHSLPKPSTIRAYGDHKWLEPESELAKDIEKSGNVISKVE